MKKITEQLTAFYKAKGLRGAALQSCVKKDLKKVEKNLNFTRDREIQDWDGYLLAAFGWDKTPEGFEYWYERSGF